MYQIWAQETSTVQSTVVLIEIIIWDTVLIQLNGGVSSTMKCVLLSRDLTHFLPDAAKYISYKTAYG